MILKPNNLKWDSDSEDLSGDDKDDDDDDDDDDELDFSGADPKALSECDKYCDALWQKVEAAVTKLGRINDDAKVAYDSSKPLEGMDKDWLGPAPAQSKPFDITLSTSNWKSILSFLIDNFKKESFENGATQIETIMNYCKHYRTPTMRFKFLLKETYGVVVKGKSSKVHIILFCAVLGEKMRIAAGSNSSSSSTSPLAS